MDLSKKKNKREDIRIEETINWEGLEKPAHNNKSSDDLLSTLL